jgi:hypothetical protein
MKREVLFMKRTTDVLQMLILLASISPASSQVLNVANELQQRLQRFGKFTLAGHWDGGVCKLVGLAPKEYLLVINDEGILTNGISIGGPETILAVGSLGEDKKTFKNCNSTPSSAGAVFSANVSKTLAVSFTNGFSTTVGGNLTVSAGAPGYGSAAIGISGSKTWSASSTTTQTTSLAVTMGNNYSTMVAPGQELDITYRVLSERVRLPVSAAGLFDAILYPCQDTPQGQRRVSGLLAPSERMFTARGNIEFDNVQEGTFSVSSPRPTQCTAPGLFQLPTGQTVGNWTGTTYTLTPAAQ